MARVAARSPVAFAIGAIAFYLVVMFALAALYLHPPLLGWIGLLVVAAVAVCLSVAVVTMFPRLRTNADRVRAGAGDIYRLLVVSDARAAPEVMQLAVAARTAGRRAVVRIVSPVLAGPLHFLTTDEVAERAAAGRRLRDAVQTLAATGVAAEGVVGADDPLVAAADALTVFPADELLFVGTLPQRRTWSDLDFEGRAGVLFGLPCATVYGDPAA